MTEEQLTAELPRILRGERFPMLRDLARWSLRTYSKPLYTQDECECNIDRLQRMEEFLVKLDKQANLHRNTTCYALIETHALRTYFEVRLSAQATRTTGNVLSSVMSDVAKELQERPGLGLSPQQPAKPTGTPIGGGAHVAGMSAEAAEAYRQFGAGSGEAVAQ
jgi:hypothetical protein